MTKFFLVTIAFLFLCSTSKSMEPLVDEVNSSSTAISTEPAEGLTEVPEEVLAEVPADVPAEVPPENLTEEVPEEVTPEPSSEAVPEPTGGCETEEPTALVYLCRFGPHAPCSWESLFQSNPGLESYYRETLQIADGPLPEGPINPSDPLVATLFGTEIAVTMDATAAPVQVQFAYSIGRLGRGGIASTDQLSQNHGTKTDTAQPLRYFLPQKVTIKNVDQAKLVVEVNGGAKVTLKKNESHTFDLTGDPKVLPVTLTGATSD